VQLWDEVGKVGPAVANTQLVLMQQRKIKPGKHWVPAPVISIFGASNEFLDKDLAAFADRFLVWLRVDYLKEPGKFAALLQSAVFDPTSQTLTNPPSITLDELHAVIEHVKTIPVPSSIVDTILKLRAELNGHGIRPSDRRFKQAIRLLQANAFINGRDVVDDDDLLIFEHVLWTSIEEKDKVTRAVNALASEFAKAAQRMIDSIAEWEAGIDERKALKGPERAEYGGEVQFKMQETTRELNELIKKAKKQGRSTARLESVEDALQGLRLKVLVDCMGLDEDRARARVEKDGKNTQGI
jgi:MoxR-like ATPase